MFVSSMEDSLRQMNAEKSEQLQKCKPVHMSKPSAVLARKTSEQQQGCSL
jgi:hypothetical protein